VELRISTAA